MWNNEKFANDLPGDEFQQLINEREMMGDGTETVKLRCGHSLLLTLDSAFRMYAHCTICEEAAKASPYAADVK
jgi:hypothetical protein